MRRLTLIIHTVSVLGVGLGVPIDNQTIGTEMRVITSNSNWPAIRPSRAAAKSGSDRFFFHWFCSGKHRNTTRPSTTRMNTTTTPTTTIMTTTTTPTTTTMTTTTTPTTTIMTTTTTPTTTTMTTTTTPDSTVPTTTKEPCDCGYNEFVSNRVVGGSFHDDRDHFPWQAYITSSGIICAGAFISLDWVLSSASCLYPVRLNKVSVEGDSSNTYYFPERRTGDVILNPGFSFPSTFQLNSYIPNDIALIKLDSAISLTYYPVCLPFAERNMSFAFETVNITGWGKTTFPYNIYVSSANLTVLAESDTRCPSVSPPQTSLCLSVNTSLGPCDDDGGSPVLWGDSMGFVKLVGITGYNMIACNSSATAIRVTRVTEFLHWIVNTTGADFCIP